MKFGVGPAGAGRLADPELAAGFAVLAEDLGFESLWSAEHLVVPAGYDPVHPYSADGGMKWPDDTPWSESLVWLAFAAAHTQRIGLATGVLVLPQRNPVVLAKQAATLDRLSGGRLSLGCGTGWLREEGDAVGIDWSQRGRMCDEFIQALRHLWLDDAPTFEGEYVRFHEAHCRPRPARPGGVPIVVAGHSEAAARRAGRLGDGYFPITDEQGLSRLLPVMRAAATEVGRDPERVEITVYVAAEPGAEVIGQEGMESIRRFADLGVSRFVYDLPFDTATLIGSVTLGDLRVRLSRFADEVMDRWR